jgi:hypothetical protein
MYRKTRRVRRNKRRSTKRRMHRTKKMRGGGGCNAMPPAGATAFGAPYNATDMVPKGNYYSYNSNVEQWPAQSNAILNGPMFKMHGGRRRKGRKGKKTRYGKKQRGGGITEFVTALLPQEVVSIGRALPASLGHMYDKFNGATPSASSMVYPTDQPLVKQIYADAGTAPTDISRIYNQKNLLVSGI